MFEGNHFAMRAFTSSQLEHKPILEAGMYFVQYEGGYFSFSPADAFEKGYTPAEQEPVIVLPSSPCRQSDHPMGRTENSAHRTGNEVGRCPENSNSPRRKLSRSRNKFNTASNADALPLQTRALHRREIPPLREAERARQAVYEQADAVLTEIAQQMEGPVLTKARQQLADAAKAKHLVRIAEDGRQLQLRESSADEKGILGWGHGAVRQFDPKVVNL